MTALTLRADQFSDDAQLGIVGADTFSPAASLETIPTDESRQGNQTHPSTRVAAIPTVASSADDKTQQPATVQSSNDVQGLDDGGWLLDPTLALLADLLDDLEKTRIANENRLRALTRAEVDSDGEIRGLGLDDRHPAVRRVTAIVASLAAAEHDAELALGAQLRTHPLGPWMKAQPGIGAKQGARLLAAVDDPYWNFLHGRPRTVSELWAYSGYHVLPAGQGPVDSQNAIGVAATRTKGQKSNWSSTAKMRAYLCAVSCVKQPAGTRYRAVYDAGRAKYDDAVHLVACKRCGPAGKPALPGSPLSPGHQHARAVRLIAKEILKDLWIASRDLYEAAA